jgi:hypothetical protein
MGLLHPPIRAQKSFGFWFYFFNIAGVLRLPISGQPDWFSYENIYNIYHRLDFQK